MEPAPPSDKTPRDETHYPPRHIARSVLCDLMLLARLAEIGDGSACRLLCGNARRFIWIVDEAAEIVRRELIGCAWPAAVTGDPRRPMFVAGEGAFATARRHHWATVCSMLRRIVDGPELDGDLVDAQVVAGLARLLIALAVARGDGSEPVFRERFGKAWLAEAAIAWAGDDEAFMLEFAHERVRALWAESPLYPMALARDVTPQLGPACLSILH